MSNLAATLKGEITRLARKEVRSAVDPLRKQIAAQRKDIAALKRERDELKRNVVRLRKATPAVQAEPEAEANGRPRRFSADGLKSLRAKLGLSMVEMAKLVGVASQSIYNWEHERARPRQVQLERIAELRSIGKREARKRLDETPEAKPRRGRRRNGQAQAQAQ